VVTPVTSCNAANPGQTTLQQVQQSQLSMEVAVRAFACDVTRVASVEFGHHQGVQINPIGGQLDIVAGDWHNDITHSGAGNGFVKMRRLEAWLSKNFVDTSNLLRATPAPDGNGTLWDQTMLVWSRDMGDAVNHQGTDMPFVVGGGAGGYLRHQSGGRLISGRGAAHEQVLLAILQGMGATSFAGFGSGSETPFAGLRG
jgi:hypothetical protein